MTNGKRDRYQRALRRERDAVAKDITEATAEHEVDLSTTDKADLATIALERQGGERLLERELHQLDELDHALERIDQRHSTFGYCVACGAEIPESRLELLPATTRCVRHAEPD